MSENPKKRSAEDIEADLQRTREELTAAVNELTTRLSPKANAKAAADNAKASAAQFAGRAKGVASDAGAGDPSALGIIAAAVGTIALAGFLIAKK